MVSVNDEYTYVINTAAVFEPPSDIKIDSLFIIPNEEKIENIQEYVIDRCPHAKTTLSVYLGYDIGSYTGPLVISGGDIKDFKKYQHLKHVHVTLQVTDRELDLGSYTHFNFRSVKIVSSLDNIKYCQETPSVEYNPNYGRVNQVNNVNISPNMSLNQDQTDDILSKFSRILGKCTISIKNEVKFSPKEMARLKIDILHIHTNNEYDITNLMTGEYPKKIMIYKKIRIKCDPKYDPKKKVIGTCW